MIIDVNRVTISLIMVLAGDDNLSNLSVSDGQLRSTPSPSYKVEGGGTIIIKLSV